MKTVAKDSYFRMAKYFSGKKCRRLFLNKKKLVRFKIFII